MDEKMKQWIDNASYEDLLERWRFAPIGSRWFQGDIGEYYKKVMLEKKAKDPERHVKASKEIGW